MRKLSEATRATVKKEEKKEVLLLPQSTGIVVEDKQDRSKLTEGRNYQMGFAFCKRTGDYSFETVQPISPCKDYLNDVVYTEATGKPLTACGLVTTYQNIFDGNISYLAVKILPTKGGDYYTGNLTNDRENLRKNIDNIRILLNYVEEKLNVPGPPTDYDVAINDPDIYLFYLPYYWCQSTHLISLYSLLIRMGQFWDGEGTPENFLTNYNNPLDKTNWTGAFPKYKRISRYGAHIITPMELAETRNLPPDNHAAIHHCGILTY